MDYQDIPVNEAWLAELHQLFSMLNKRNLLIKDEDIASTIIEALGDRAVGIATEIRGNYFKP